MKILQNRLLALVLAAPAFFAPACSDDNDNPTPADDNEQITYVAYTLTPRNGGTAVTATWTDLDGTGGNAPTITPLTLTAGTVYDGTIALLDQTKNPVENITDEVREESDEHLFVYTTSPAALLTIARTDKDRNNREIGLTTAATAGTVGTGTLNVVLRHQPGTKDGTATPGDSDVDVVFPVTVQ